jgi:hypothetical protein
MVNATPAPGNQNRIAGGLKASTIPELVLEVPASAQVGKEVYLALLSAKPGNKAIEKKMEDYVVVWSVSDSSPQAKGYSAKHTFNQDGTYKVLATLYKKGDTSGEPVRSYQGTITVFTEPPKPKQ